MSPSQADIQGIYAILLSKGYQDQLFQDLPGQRKKAKGGQETLADCPLCHKEGHFSYSSQKPLWKCWSCGRGGDWIKYLEEARRLDFRQALHFLAGAAGVEISAADSQAYQAYTKKADLLEAAQALFVADLQKPAGQPVLQYLLDRGYTEQDIQGMELGAFVDRNRLQQELAGQGYTQQEIASSGLLTKGFGEDYTITLLWRDPAGRAIGIATRPPLSNEELAKQGLTKYKYSFGLEKDKGLTGFTSARGAEQIVLLEGVLDALYLNSKGLNSVAVGGTSLSAEQIKALELTGTKELLLALDSDKAGQDATARVLSSLSSSSLRPYVVSLPTGYKDPDELVRAKGIEAFQQLLQKAESREKWLARHIVSQHDLTTDRGRDKALEASLEYYVTLEDKLRARDFLDSLTASTGLSAEDIASRVQEYEHRSSHRRSQELIRATLRRVEDRASGGDLIGAEQALSQGLQEIRSSRGVQPPEAYLLMDLEIDIENTSEALTTGYTELDKVAKIPQGAIAIIAGRPGHGKTSLQLNLLLNLARHYPDRRFYFFSYEEAKKWLALKLIMILADKSLVKQGSNLYAYLNYFQQKRGRDKEIEQAIKDFEQFTLSGKITLSDKMLTAEDLAATISYLARRGDTGAVLVDYIQKIPLQRPLQGQRYVEIKRVSELLLEQAVTHDIPVIMGAQLGRAKGQGDKVTLDNLRESGDIEQDANTVLGLYNETADKIEEGQEDKGEAADLSISVLKNRAGAAGKQCTLKLHKASLRISDPLNW